MRVRASLTILFAVLWILPWQIARSQQSSPSDAEVQSLREALQKQQQQIRDLERRLEAQEARDFGVSAPAATAAAPAADLPAAAAPAAAATPATAAAKQPLPPLLGTFSDTGLRIASADGQNALHLGANLAMDYRYFDDAYDKTSADTWLVRKARLVLEGELDGRYDFRFMPDFGQGKTLIQDAWVAGRIAPWLVLTAGKFKAPVGLERLQLEQYARFIEASLTADLEPYRDLGALVSGTVHHGLLSYQLGVFDGAPDGGSTDGNSIPDSNSSGKFTWDSRVFTLPFVLTPIELLKGFGLGVAGTYANVNGTATATTTNSLLAADKTTGQQSMFSYRANTSDTFNNATMAHGIERRLVPQAYWYYRMAYLMGEYVRENQQVSRRTGIALTRRATLTHEAWQIQGGFYLTGEPESYDGNPVSHPVGHGGWGAWELVARYHQLRYDPSTYAGESASFANGTTAVQAAYARGIGLNWYLTRAFRMQLDFEDTTFRGGSAAGNRAAEKVLTAQGALIF